jgi:hypothetical protein
MGRLNETNVAIKELKTTGSSRSMEHMDNQVGGGTAAGLLRADSCRLLHAVVVIKCTGAARWLISCCW